MRGVAVVLAGCVLLAGCGIFKNTTKKKAVQKVETSVVQKVTRDDSAKVLTSSVTARELVDTSGYVTRENYERTATRPDVSFPFSGNLVNGVLQVQSGLFTVAIQLDSTGKALSGVATVPGGTETERGTRVTTGKKGVTEKETGTASSAAESGSKLSAVTVEHAKTENVEEESKSTVDWKLYAFIGLTLAGIVIFIWHFIKK